MKKLILIVISTLGFGSLSIAATKTFKMYATPHAFVKPECDKYTELSLETDGSVVHAKLTNRVSGVCMMIVPKNERIYTLELSATECGSNHYADPKKAPELAARLVDNRARICDNVIAALIVFSEHDSGGKEHLLFSKE